MGIVSCSIVLICFRFILRDHVLNISLTLVSCYITFFVGEIYLKVSGIISIVTLGVMMGGYGKMFMSHDSIEFTHIVLSYLQYTLESLLFVITGAYIGKDLLYSALSSLTASDFLKILPFFPIMVIARFIMIYIHWPLINKTGWPLSLHDLFVLTYGGLRGAIALVLSLIILADKEFNQRFRELTLLFVTSMIAITVLLNGLTMKWFMKQIGFGAKSDSQISVYNRLKQKFILNAILHKQAITENKYFKLADWNVVLKVSKVIKEVEFLKQKRENYMS